ncbi:MAG TPA: 4Fe-4S binding protein [Caldisericia bacterium]|nr:4Fe-4S binding protein [Caldisericia bacterium]HPB33804.1 4Fe-4S binding protein [Caldisericia bacterium]HQL66271.1 4Fe-4S binding protein [Caldisericia bacterium]HQN48655.1 4Fe-4S binding protein [Caldisericia bacterium]HQO99216.1 4Fe-4S binding protein [Caldisericia bacterium]
MQHADFKPPLNFEKCIGYGKCSEHYPENAIQIIDKKAKFDYSKCIGCGECVTVSGLRQLEYAEKIDLGERNYKIIEI